MAKYQLTKQIDAVNQHDADAFTAFYAPDASVTRSTRTRCEVATRHGRTYKRFSRRFPI